MAAYVGPNTGSSRLGYLSSKYGTKAINVVEFHHKIMKSGETAVVPTIHVDRIEKIIKDSNADNIPVVIISLAGPARTGKSFFLNLMIDYNIHQAEKMDCDWKRAQNRISGFDWAQSGDAVTHGMWMWERAIVTNLKDGSKVAFLYLDTQGTGDKIHSSTPHVDSLIMFLSLEIANIQIQNINGQLKVEDIREYEVYKMYNELIEKEKKDCKPYNCLILLYRNWQNDQMFGFRDDYINNEIEQYAGKPVSEAYCATLRGIKESFNSVHCTMLPHPGKKVTQATGEISLSVVDEDFLKEAESLFVHIFSPNCGFQKDMAARKRGKDFIRVLQELDIRVRSTEVPAILTPMHHLAETWNAKVYQQASDVFVEGLDKCSSYVENTGDMKYFNEALIKNKRMAIGRYSQKAFKDNGQAIFQHYLNKLDELIEQVGSTRFDSLLQRHLAQEELRRNGESDKYNQLKKELEDLKKLEESFSTKRGWGWRDAAAKAAGIGVGIGAFIVGLASTPVTAPVIIGKLVHEVFKSSDSD